MGSHPGFRTARATRPARGFVLALLVTASAVAGGVHGQDDAAFYEDPALVKLLELGLTDNRADAPLRELTVEIGPRLTGSSNLTRAVQWARAEFEALGLETRVETWGTFSVGFERDPSEGGMVAPARRPYEFMTYAWTAGTDGPRRGAARLYPESAEWLEANADAYRGAWVVRSLPRDLPPFAARRVIEARLDELGAAGHVRGGGRDLLVMSGDPAVDPDALPRRVEVRLVEVDYTDLLARLQAGEDIELSFDIRNRFVPGPIALHNVVAELQGTEFPEETVIVAAHLDSWDGAQGAQDNAVGVATTIEAARLLVASGARPRRTVRFVLFTGKEQGLLGSTAYVAAHADELDTISAMFVHDGGTNFISGVAGPAPVVAALERAFLPVMHLDPIKPFRVIENGGLPREGGSDHMPFVLAGVPAFFWRQTGEANYARVHHTQFDTLEHVRMDYVRHSALVVAVGAYNLARLDERLDRTDLLESAPRPIGVYLDGTTVASLSAGRARDAGWEAGDVVLSVDGVSVETREALLAEVSRGGPRKTFLLRRGEAEIESVLDWSTAPPRPEDEDTRRPKTGDDTDP